MPPDPLADATERKTFETFGHVLPPPGNHIEGDLRYVKLMSDPNPPRAAECPFSSRALRPTWASRRSRTFAGLAVVAALAAFAAQWPIRLVDVDGITLRVALPATLAFVLSFAPRPASRVGRIARELTVLGLCAGMFAGDRLPMLLAWLIRFPYLGGAFQRLIWLHHQALALARGRAVTSILIPTSC
jgi:hypothetical protein